MCKYVYIYVCDGPGGYPTRQHYCGWHGFTFSMIVGFYNIAVLTAFAIYEYTTHISLSLTLAASSANVYLSTSDLDDSLSNDRI